MAVYGGDLLHLDELARRFNAEAASVEALRTRISANLESAAWTGPAADRFRERWAGEFVPSLRRLEASLARDRRAGVRAAAVVAARRRAIEAATT